MISRTSKTDRIAAICAMIWFVFIIDACFTWFFSWTFRYFVGVPFVVFATMRLLGERGLVFSKQRRILFGIFLVLALYLFFVKKSMIIVPIEYGPFLLILFWRKSALMQFYVYFKNFVIFFSLVSIFAEVLVLTGIWRSLPSITFPPQDNVQENIGTINHFYGLFVIPEGKFDVSFYRAMGPLREGGHFSVFIGFAYFIEKVVFRRSNILLLISGFLTISPNFLFFFLVAETYYAIIIEKLIRTVLRFLCLITLFFMALYYSPSTIKDEIVRIFVERSLEENLSNVQYDGYMALLDGRVNSEGESMINRFSKADVKEKIIGINKLKKGYVLSDFRYLLYCYGYLGLSLFLLCSVMISKEDGNGFLFSCCVFLMVLYVMLSRAWMFEQLYIWTMALMAVVAKSYNDRLLCKTL